jgi:hypothetical protein
MIVWRDHGNLSTVCSKMVNKHQSRATDTIDRTKRLGAEKNALPLESIRELGEVMAGIAHLGCRRRLGKHDDGFQQSDSAEICREDVPKRRQKAGSNSFLCQKHWGHK